MCSSDLFLLLGRIVGETLFLGPDHGPIFYSPTIIIKESKKKNTRHACPVNQKEKKEKKKKAGNRGKKKVWRRETWIKPMCNCSWTFLFKNDAPISFFSFLFILGRKLFGESKKKTLRPHNLFSFLPT